MKFISVFDIKLIAFIIEKEQKPYTTQQHRILRQRAQQDTIRERDRTQGKAQAG
jgi:hypothetical protein